MHQTSTDSLALKYTTGILFKSHHLLMLARDTKEIGRLPDSFAQQAWKHYVAKKGSGGANLLTHGIFYAVNLALAKGNGICGLYIHFANQAGILEQAVFLGNGQLIDKVLNHAETTQPTAFKSAEKLALELALLYDREELRALYLNSFSEGAPPRERYVYTVFIFILFVTLIIGQRCKNPSMPKTLAECHQEFLGCCGDTSQEILCADLVVAIDERFKLFEILHDYNGMSITIDDPGEWKVLLGTLIHASLLIRGDMYNQEMATVQSNSPNSVLDLDKLFLAWAVKSHHLITGGSPQELYSNPYQEMLHIMCLKEALGVYYNSIIEIFEGQ